MKVIAKVDSDRVLCEVSMEEVAWLNGFKNQLDPAFIREHFTRVETEFSLARMVATSRFVRSIRKDVLESVKVNLEKTLAQLDETISEVSKLEVFEILKDEEKV
jgi:hypothetical protein